MKSIYLMRESFFETMTAMQQKVNTGFILGVWKFPKIILR